MRVNYRVNATPQFRVLSDDQIEEVFLSALEVLERTGTRVCSKEGLALLTEAGARVTEGNLVRIPSWLVRGALGTAPERIVVAGRDRSRRLMLEDNRTYYMTEGDCLFLIDPYSDERRRYTLQDVYRAAKIVDALPHIDLLYPYGQAGDVPVATYDRHEFLATVRGTTKPLVISCMDAEGLADQYDMACILLGGEEEFRNAPLFINWSEPTSPLVHSKSGVEKLLYAAEKGIPTIYVPTLLGGGTAPATMAGVLVQNLAECLSGLVLAQFKNPGVGIIMGGTVSIMDMRTSILAYGAPELHLLSAALTDIAKWLGLPMCSTGGCSDAKRLDEQAAVEAALSIALAALSGANIVHNVGGLESSMIGSYDMLVLCDEIISLCKRICRGIVVDEEHLAVDVIDKVGPGGNFLTEDHTLKHFRAESWYPEVLDRHRREEWVAKGSKSTGERVREKVIDIIENYELQPIPQDVLLQLKGIVARADRRHEGEDVISLV